MSVIRILIFFSVLIAGPAFGQGFLRTYAPTTSSAREVVQTADGGYFTAGAVSSDQTLQFLRTDASGLTIWSKQIALQGAKSVATCATSDGGFVVLTEGYSNGGIQKNVLLKIDDFGDVVWLSTVDNGVYANGLQDVIALPDGSFWAIGSMFDPNQNLKNRLVKFSADGTLQWQKSFGAAYRNIRKIILLPSGNVTVAGSGADLYLAQLNPAGDLLWEKNYPAPETQTCYDLIPTVDGGLAALCSSPGELSNGVVVLNMAILHTDLNGNKLWYENYYPFPTPQPNGTPTLPVFNSFAQDLNGNFYLPFWGFVDDPFNSELELLKIDPNGAALAKNPLHTLGNAFQILPTADQYLIIAGDNNAVQPNTLLLKVDTDGEYLSNRIQGQIFRDLDMDCILSAGEPGKTDIIVRAENQAGEVFVKSVNPDGSYELRVTEGTFTILAQSVYGPSIAYLVCDTPTVKVTGNLQAVTAPPIGVQVLAECPLMDVEITGGLFRRCLTSQFSINWCNSGNQTADNVYVELTMDPAFSYLSSSLPLTSQNGNVFRFDIGTVVPLTCSSMTVKVLVSCNHIVGDVLCAEAHIFPDTTCSLNTGNLDGSKIEVSGLCTGSEIEFRIKNVGTGNMTQSADYVIIEDEIMYAQPSFQLAANQEMTSIRIPMPDDSCFALRVFPNQTSILSKPISVVENCTANGNLNLLLLLPNNENDLSKATFCGPIIGSFDPNDKTALPIGLSTAHYLERGDDIDYTIRFQNTGNDTAFLVVLHDTLPATLDPATIRPIGASHPYTWEVTSEGILKFTFANILLPDSTKDEPGSHGFASFRISQKPNLPDGTLIENNASIYFDFNEAIITNTWFHTIGRPSVVATQSPTGGASEISILIAPNPVAAEAMFQLQDYEPQGPLDFSLYDTMGKKLRSESFQGKEFLFKKQDLPAGIYFWQIHASGKILAIGRLVAE